MSYFVINYDARKVPQRPWYGGHSLGSHSTLVMLVRRMRQVMPNVDWRVRGPWYIDPEYQFNDRSWAVWVDTDIDPDTMRHPSTTYGRPHASILVPTFREALHITLQYARWLPSKRIPE